MRVERPELAPVTCLFLIFESLTRNCEPWVYKIRLRALSRWRVKLEMSRAYNGYQSCLHLVRGERNVVSLPFPLSRPPNLMEPSSLVPSWIPGPRARQVERNMHVLGTMYPVKR